MLIVKLLLAHMLGDFLLQPGRALRHKQARKAGSWFFYLHGLVHFSLTLLLVWDLRFWQEALVIAASHLVIDAVKLYTAHWYRRDSIPFSWTSWPMYWSSWSWQPIRIPQGSWRIWQRGSTGLSLPVCSL
ncbi:DUF3307 domain-containing protein [Robiginitalea biformata]|uniref:DUF3307 domain-containing protein n=1 Tax=Robiginitalea biformata TaxID=252307 RepID=UPI003BAC601B